MGWSLPVASDAALASIHLDSSLTPPASRSLWIYALVAPFPTILDGISLDQLRAVWTGESSEPFAKWPLWLTASTLSGISGLWGAPAAAVQTAAPEKLVDTAWANRPSWAIVPFEGVEPRWKVLTVDGQSPVRKDFDPAAYPLKISFVLSSIADANLPALPATNRDPSRMSTVIMTGTSSLVRELAYQMEVKGIDYPAQDIGDWLREADVLHVSNETSFDPSCPPPNPLRNRFFCSDPRYLGLFDHAGVDVVELTGNHILDNGTASMLFTLDLYRQHNMPYFGGGADLADARKPLLIENHGNNIAFVGCNAGEPPEPWAEVNLPGANPCDWKQFTAQIRQLRAKGYLPIATFQYKEGYSPMVMPWQALDFRRAADAGAVIVSGSQSHVPLEMEMYKGVFIHYGLGNLFFGQMGNHPPGPGLPLQPAERYEFLDRHVFYAGRYINTELLTAMLEDYARPRPMTPDERAELLRAYFGYSDWLPFIATLAPEKTATLYPLLNFRPLPTHTPLPEATRQP
jgi:poly-gamma-glutamate synthesis protein (capsule biosynthesis protein)